MKKYEPDFIGVSSERPLDLFQKRLLEIYWDKKNLEEFLPKIATYSTQQELVTITLAQLSIIEKQVVWLLQEMSGLDKEGDGDSGQLARV